MGLAARTYDAATVRTRPGHLAAVREGAQPQRGRTRGATNPAPRQRELFTAFTIALVVLSLVGLARIAVTARAAATSIESAQLRKAIKAERLEGNLLEIQESALATPSRIQEIAGSTMRMSEAGRVCYIQLDGTEVCEPAARPQQAGTTIGAAESEAASGGVVSSLLRAALGEAQVLLLGDVALASSR